MICQPANQIACPAVSNGSTDDERERREREGGGREGERDTLTWTAQFNKIMDKLMWQGAREQVTT